VITFYTEPFMTEPGDIDLGEDAAHHAQVRRVGVGDRVVATTGIGYQGIGRVASLGKRSMVVTIERIVYPRQPRPLHLFVPVADKERMLWLAEKATEFQISTWTPVMYNRSRSVSPRGEGEAFDKKLRARMIAALEQSGGAWLPEIDPIREVHHMQTPSDTKSFLLDRLAPSLAGRQDLLNEVYLAVGPEGGFEPEERDALLGVGWIPVSLADSTLRFETAAMAAVAIVRASGLAYDRG
jgi:16S rRNA (uracil1498-N3)-methyltransferase